MTRITNIIYKCVATAFAVFILFSLVSCGAADNDNKADNVQEAYIYIPVFSQYGIQVPTEENGDICGSVGADF
ncbi:MAG: hypothetical protein ACI4R6_02720, partial [Lachnospiraceae bacterium]